MNLQTRPAAAAIAAAIFSRRKVTAVYCFTSGRWFNIDAEILGDQVKAYDYQRAAFIEGQLPSSVYDYETSGFLEFKFDGGKVDGYDYASSSFFEVTKQSDGVSFYDFGDGGFHNYSIRF